jgi:CSLREA domain-containing protein
LRIEPLEDRRPLAITVDTLVDEVDGSIVDGDVSLRDAIAASPAGGVINFSVTGTINLALGAVVVQDRIIQGPGAAQLTIDAHGASQTFITRGTTTLSGLTITGGNGVHGGGIRNDSVPGIAHLTVTNSVITGNTASRGGGIYSSENPGSDDTVTVVNSTISGNQAIGEFNPSYRLGTGGGIHGGFALVTIDRSTISGNDANAYGGGVYGAVTMTNSTVAENRAGENQPAGGIFVRGAATISNSTISGNTGFGIQCSDGVAVVANSTITQNLVGIYSLGRATLLNSIVAGNEEDIRDTINAGASRNNLIGALDDSGGLVDGVNGNIVGVAEPGLGPLANNGGPTETHALWSFSPAVNAGDNSLVPDDPDTGLPFTVDQTGAARIFGGGTVDMGAVEFQETPVPSTVVNTAADDVAGNALTSLREAVGFARTLGGHVTFDPMVFATPQTIALVHGKIRAQDVTINGPGAALATVDAGGASRIFSTYGMTTLSGLTITGGVAEDTDGDGRLNGFNDQGAINNQRGGTLTIQDCVISGNATSGVSNNATLVVLNSTISDNHELGAGGGIIASGIDTDTITIVNSTISGNSAAHGGGIFTGNPTTIRNSTISGNSAFGDFVPGGGILQHSYSAAIFNSIVAGNTNLGSPNDVMGISVQLAPASAYNLIGSEFAGGLVNGVNGNIVGVDPALVLGPLANNGGPTPTHALLPGSPAIDAGNPAFDPNAFMPPLVNDQRGPGFARVIGNGIDIGAFEMQSPPLPGDYNFDGTVNAADYTIWRDTLDSTTDLRANGDASNSVIDAGDYNVWTTNFGETVGTGASVSIAGSSQSPESAARSSAAFESGADTPVRSPTPRSPHGGQECPPHNAARALALLDLLYSERKDDEDFDFASRRPDSEPDEVIGRDAAFAQLGQALAI